MTSAIETALTELSANLRRMEQRHQATGYKFDRLYGLIAAAREELATLTPAAHIAHIEMTGYDIPGVSKPRPTIVWDISAEQQRSLAHGAKVFILGESIA